MADGSDPKRDDRAGATTLAIFAGGVAAANLARAGDDRPKKALELAAALRRKGASEATIYAETNKMLAGSPYAGVSYGADGKPRFEIADDTARLKASGLPKGAEGYVGDVIDHPKLYDAYPEARLLGARKSGKSGGGYTGTEITLGADHVAKAELAGRPMLRPSAKGVLLHELQHYAQDTEGHAPGGSPRDFADRFPGPQNEMLRYEMYSRLAGEVESENTRNRGDMSAGERRAVHPVRTEDIPRFDQIVTDEHGAVVEGRLQEMAEPPIKDFGQKIGGARKDRAVKIGPRSAKAAADTRPGWARRFEISEIAASSDKSQVGKFSVTDTKKKNWYGQPKEIGIYATRAEAEQAVPLAALAQNHSVSGTRDGQFQIYRKTTKGHTPVGEKFPTREAALRHMADHAVELLSERPKQGYGENLLRQVKITHKERIGPAVRQGDIAPETFLKTFGARGVEFGHWEEGARRQGLVNTAYESLYDLSRVTGLKPNQITLGGQLGVSFGARGTGGINSGAATYHPDYGTMNFTKPHGAGALAHEWFHALDHAMGRADDPALDTKRVNAHGDQVWNTAGDMHYASQRVAGYPRTKALHEEVRAAYDDLMKTMTTKNVAEVEDAATLRPAVERRATTLTQALERIRADLMKEVTYRQRGNKPATAEQLARFDKLAATIKAGEVAKPEWKFVGNPNASILDLGGMTTRYSSPELEQLSALMKEVRGRSGFDTTNRNGPLDEVAREMVGRAELAQRIADAEAGKPISSTTKTDFYRNAVKLDQTRTTPYWTQRHEMFARAGETYVYDKLAANKLASPYLVSGAENTFEAAWAAIKGGMDDTPKPFPEGAERAAINAKFDRLLEAIRKHGLVGEAPNTEPSTAYSALDWNGKPPTVVSTAAPAAPATAAAQDIRAAMQSVKGQEVGPGLRGTQNPNNLAAIVENREANAAPEAPPAPVKDTPPAAPAREVRQVGKKFVPHENGKPLKDSKGNDKWFGSKDKAQAFLDARSTPPPAAPRPRTSGPVRSKTAAPRPAVIGDNGAPPDTLLKAAKRLEEVAKRTIAAGEQEVNRPRLMNTARRARMGSGMIEEAQQRIADAKTALKIAEALRNGEAGALSTVKSLADIRELRRLAKEAEWATDRKQGRSWTPGGHGLKPEDVTNVGGAKGYVRLEPSTVDELRTALAGKKGLAADFKTLARYAETAKARNSFETSDPAVFKAIQNVANAVKKADKLNVERPFQAKSLKWSANKYLEEVRDFNRRVKLAGPDPAARQEALKAFLDVRAGKVAPSPAAIAERDLIGMKLPGFFPTPESLAKRMAELADIQKGQTVLEPSAGTGRLADAAKALGAQVDTVEMQSRLRDILSKKGHNLVASDFTEIPAEPRYDRILMNPPFEKGQDMAHVQRAYEMLKPGGKMVAVMGEGGFFRSDKQATGFRSWLDSVGGTSEKLPEGTFKESNTGVNTRLVTISKPAATAEAALAASTGARPGWSDAAREASIEARAAETPTVSQSKVPKPSELAAMSEDKPKRVMEMAEKPKLSKAEKAKITRIAEKAAAERGVYRAQLHAMATAAEANTPERQAQMEHYRSALSRIQAREERAGTIVEDPHRAERERIANGTKRIGDTYKPPAPAEPTKVDAFAAGMKPNMAAKTKAALEMQIRHNGKEFLSRAALVERWVAGGAKVETTTIGGRPQRVLMSKEGTFLDTRAITKTGLDYAEHIAQKAAPLQSAAQEAGIRLPDLSGMKPEGMGMFKPGDSVLVKNNHLTRNGGIDGRLGTVKEVAPDGRVTLNEKFGADNIAVPPESLDHFSLDPTVKPTAQWSDAEKYRALPNGDKMLSESYAKAFKAEMERLPASDPVRSLKIEHADILAGTAWRPDGSAYSPALLRAAEEETRRQQEAAFGQTKRGQRAARRSTPQVAPMKGMAPMGKAPAEISPTSTAGNKPAGWSDAAREASAKERGVALPGEAKPVTGSPSPEKVNPGYAKPAAPKPEVLKASEIDFGGVKSRVGNSLATHQWEVDNGGKVTARVKTTSKGGGEIKTAYLHVELEKPDGSKISYRETAKGTFKETGFQPSPTKPATRAVSPQTVADLRTEAKAAGIKGASKMSKSALLEALGKSLNKAGAVAMVAAPAVAAYVAFDATKSEAKAAGATPAEAMASAATNAAVAGGATAGVMYGIGKVIGAGLKMVATKAPALAGPVGLAVAGGLTGYAAYSAYQRNKDQGTGKALTAAALSVVGADLAVDATRPAEAPAALPPPPASGPVRLTNDQKTQYATANASYQAMQEANKQAAASGNNPGWSDQARAAAYEARMEKAGKPASNPPPVKKAPPQ